MPQMQVADKQEPLDEGLTIDQAAEMLNLDDLDDIQGDAEKQPAEPEEQAEEEAAEAKEEQADEEPEEVEQEPLTPEAIAAALDMDPAEFMAEFKLSRKVDGKVEEVTLAEALAGNQREADYTRKTMELAERQKAIVEAEQVRQQQVDMQAQLAAQIVQNNFAELNQQYQAEDWHSLDPGERAERQLWYQQRTQQIQQSHQQIAMAMQQEMDQRKAKEQESHTKELQAEAERLPTVIPEWSNPTVFESERTQILEYMARHEGLTRLKDFTSNADAIALARKAWLYDQGRQAGSVARKKLADLPKMVRPGKKMSSKETSTRNTLDALKRLRKSGRVEDALAAIPDDFMD